MRVTVSFLVDDGGDFSIVLITADIARHFIIVVVSRMMVVGVIIFIILGMILIIVVICVIIFVIVFVTVPQSPFSAWSSST